MARNFGSGFAQSFSQSLTSQIGNIRAQRAAQRRAETSAASDLLISETKAESERLAIVEAGNEIVSVLGLNLEPRLLDTTSPGDPEIGAMSIAPGVTVKDQNLVVREASRKAAVFLEAGFTPDQTATRLKPLIDDFLLTKKDPAYREIKKQFPDIEQALQVYRDQKSPLGKRARVRRGRANVMLDQAGGDPRNFTLTELARYNTLIGDATTSAKATKMWGADKKAEAIGQVETNTLNMMADPAKASNSAFRQRTRIANEKIMTRAGFGDDYIRKYLDDREKRDSFDPISRKALTDAADEMMKWQLSVTSPNGSNRGYMSQLRTQLPKFYRSPEAAAGAKRPEDLEVLTDRRRKAASKWMKAHPPKADAFASQFGAAPTIKWDAFVDAYVGMMDADGNIDYQLFAQTQDKLGEELRISAQNSVTHLEGGPALDILLNTSDAEQTQLLGEALGAQQ